MLLRTFQRLSRVEQLRADGVLFACWEYVPVGLYDAYRAMVAAMRQRGIGIDNHPPLWAWRGQLRLWDAALLFDPDEELSDGYATVEFDAPAELVLLTNYGAWNDYLAALIEGRPASWPPLKDDATDPGEHAGVGLDSGHEEQPEQACVPFLEAAWVRDVRRLPTTGWDELDLSRPA